MTGALGSFILGDGALGGGEEESSTNLLVATQADNTLVATGTVTLPAGGGILSATQAPDTLVATGTVITPTPTVVRLVAKLNGPSGYIKEVDANGLTAVDIRFNGFITLPSFNPNGTAGDKLRYYRNPASEAGALLAENVDTSWSMDLHRGNGFIDLGVFSVNDAPIGGGIVLGTLSQAQTAQTIAASAKVLVKGIMTTTQAPHQLTGFGQKDKPGSVLFGVQADNFIVAGQATGRVIIKGLVAAVQVADVPFISGAIPPVSGTLAGEALIGPYLEGHPEIDGFMLADAPTIGPLLEGVVP